MELPERRRRWQALFDNVSREDVTAWRDDFVTALRARPGPEGAEPEKPARVRTLDVATKVLKAGPEAKAMRALGVRSSRSSQKPMSPAKGRGPDSA